MKKLLKASFIMPNISHTLTDLGLIASAGRLVWIDLSEWLSEWGGQAIKVNPQSKVKYWKYIDHSYQSLFSYQTKIYRKLTYYGLFQNLHHMCTMSTLFFYESQANTCNVITLAWDLHFTLAFSKSRYLIYLQKRSYKLVLC